MAVQQLPLIPSEPNYRFGTALNGKQVIIDVRWNGRDEAWYLDLLTEDEEPIRTGMKVVLGTILGGRSANADFPVGVFVASDLSGEGREATLDDLGVRVLVHFMTPEELGFEAS